MRMYHMTTLSLSHPRMLDYKGVLSRRCLKWLDVFSIFLFLLLGAVTAQIRYSIPEEMRPGLFVGDVAKDLGLEVKRLVSGRARLAIDDSRQYVELNRNKGHLVVKERIDREQLCGQKSPCSFGLEILLENPLEFFSITIEIQDINDHAPVFSKREITLEISESTPVGTIFLLDTATDLDQQSRSDGGIYAEMVLQSVLDREKQSELSLLLTAMDGGDPSRSGSVQIFIRVLDANDNLPVFTEAFYKASVAENAEKGTFITKVSASDADEGYNGNIQEDSPPGTVVALINIQDLDSGKNGQVRLSLEESSPFTIKPSPRKYYTMVTDAPLDREKVSGFNLTLVAADEGSPPLFSKQTLFLIITDINDNAPVFDTREYQAFILENNSPGVSLLSLQASDPDEGQNARVTYYLIDTDVNGSPASSFFSVNADNGIINVVRSFDYEQMKEFKIHVRVQDGGSPPLGSNATVVITVQDQNDNAPQVLYPVQSGASVVAEIVPRSADVGYLVTKVVAVDVDSGQNAWLSYKLQKAADRALFEVGAQNGEIRTVRQVTDKDAVKQRLTVVVEDNGQPPRSATVNVNVAVADSFPEVLSEFSDFTHDKDYNENLTFYLVLALAVVSFLFITCLVVIISIKIYRWKQTRLFHKSNLPVIPYYPPRYTDTVGSATLQHVPSYEIYRTTDSRKSDVKYFGPISQSLISADASGTGALMMETPVNADARSTMLAGAQFEQQGPLLIRERFHCYFFFYSSPSPFACVCEKRAQGFLDIFNQGIPLTFSMTEPRLRLKMLWLLTMCFTGHLHSVSGQIRYSIPEEMKKGSVIGNVAQDLGLDLKRLRSGRARIVTGESAHYAELKTDKGILVVSERMDREQLCGDTTPCSFSFEIILENPMELHSVTIEILDENDHAPSFQNKELKFEISESAVLGSRFLLESADDHDVGMNSLQNYILSTNNHFVLKQHSNPDGSKYAEMVLQRALDREEHPVLSLKLIAVDGGTPQRSGSVNIDVTVLDANDNAPVFNQTSAQRGTFITTVNATDADSGSNGHISYNFYKQKGAAAQLFHIESNTGVISVAGEIDHEKDAKFELTVEARDQGGLTDSSKIVVDVIDENDNAPVINTMSFSGSVSENAPPDTTIAIINVKDSDTDENGKVSCFIEGSEEFAIKSTLRNYYSLVTSAPLDREKLAEYNITVIAADSGKPPLISRKGFNLKVTDVNDNSPVFKDSVYNSYVQENNSPGGSILTVRAHDPDENQNARVSYILEESDLAGLPIGTYVSVNAESGVVFAVRSFDYEQIKHIKISIKAQDGGSPPLSSNVTVNIFIQDQNDNAPQVLYPVQSGASVVAEIVPRSADVGYLVTKVVAVDVDSGQNAWLSYKLQKAADRALFEVGAQNGEIRTVRQVTDKDAVKQRLTVVVEDNGQPPRSATVNVNVAVSDSFPEVLSQFPDFTHDKDYNENLTFYLVLGLAAVSFLFITCLVIIISIKIYRWKQSRCFHKSNLPVIPYYPPRYAETVGTGTRQHGYNYEVYRTTDSRRSDLTFVSPESQNVLIVDPNFTGTLQRVPMEKNMLDEKDSPVETRSGAVGQAVRVELRSAAVPPPSTPYYY
ncbi:hypothetical protein DNTS_031972 [Danionella cerebrum]|uniref:Cadherin domain-containing protein n=1 Tax=Danionella cerebrum TaxID=2873325 RepID=A0A553Q1N0_9TELE|nr:hypothetical protein DNTS_031972 [Danionella translucida]